MPLLYFLGPALIVAFVAATKDADAAFAAFGAIAFVPLVGALHIAALHDAGMQELLLVKRQQLREEAESEQVETAKARAAEAGNRQAQRLAVKQQRRQERHELLREIFRVPPKS